MSDYDYKIQQALVETEKEQESSPFITLSSGVVLKLKKINIMRILSVVSQFEYPPVPEIWDEAKGRMLKNADSELYQTMKADVDQQRALAVMDAIAALGTEVYSVPAGVPRPEDDSWVEECELIHIPVNRNSSLARYQAWVKFVAVKDEADLTKVLDEFGVQLGTSERKIAGQIRDNFPGEKVR